MKTSNLFTGKLLKLAVPRREDAAIRASWEEDSEYLRNLDTDIAYPRSTDQLGEERKTSSNSKYFRLRTVSDDTLIGFVVIHSIEWNNRTGSLAIGIGNPLFQNKGYGSEALQLILRYAFHELNLNRVGLDVIGYNRRAICAYQKAGFIEEGCIRSAVYRDGKFSDRIYMGILRSEWEEQQRQT
ncbi:GNAT family N-acetyltransferase [Halobacillus sp. Marseille-Q1614]|uniref:GNAT family N-acetyltransferase n=1 Tax=Halobacillus sp. Marseille-Q1614 TaxID=2709134 RepID=UPI0015714E8C|nr:GNAT family protein [Halobacillus sp. Marseille-Q1614]